MMRIKRNMSQSELARRMGVSQAYICNIEKAQRTITLENLLKLHEIMECPAADFFVDIDGEHAENIESAAAGGIQFTAEDFTRMLLRVKHELHF